MWQPRHPAVRRVLRLSGWTFAYVATNQIGFWVAQVLELAGRDVWLVPGEERNLKITTALDLRVAEMLLAEGGS